MTTPTTVPWTIVGVDCASQDKHIGLACGTLGGPLGPDHLRVLDVSAGAGPDRDIIKLLGGWLQTQPRVLLAIDAPLGWPRRLTESLQLHRAGEPLLEPEARRLVRRETDLQLRTQGHQPLDVGADRIAYAAHRALRLLGELRQATGRALPLLWPPASDSGAIEVYPAATLRVRAITTAGYKKNSAAERPTALSARGKILDRLASELELDARLRTRVLDAPREDMLDALVCVLAGADFLRGDCTAPTPAQRPLAELEGWIWHRRPQAEGGKSGGRAGS